MTARQLIEQKLEQAQAARANEPKAAGRRKDVHIRNDGRIETLQELLRELEDDEEPEEPAQATKPPDVKHNWASVGCERIERSGRGIPGRHE